MFNFSFGRFITWVADSSFMTKRFSEHSHNQHQSQMEQLTRRCAFVEVSPVVKQLWTPSDNIQTPLMESGERLAEAALQSPPATHANCLSPLSSNGGLKLLKKISSGADIWITFNSQSSSSAAREPIDFSKHFSEWIFWLETMSLGSPA